MNFSSVTSDSDAKAFALGLSSRSNDRSTSFLPASATPTSDSFATALSQAKEKHDQRSDSDESREDATKEQDKKRKAAAADDANAAQLAAAVLTPPLAPEQIPAVADSNQNASSASESALVLSNSQGCSVSELLSQGADRLNFELKNSAGKNGVAQPAPTALADHVSGEKDKLAIDSAPAGDAGAAPSGKDASLLGATKSAETTAPVNPTIGRSGVLSPAALSAALAKQEKFADSSDSQGNLGGNSSGDAGKNTTLVPDTKALKKSSGELGTSTANWGKTMPHVASTSPSVAPAASPGWTSSGSAGATTESAATDASAPTAASHAADLVHQIHEIADGIWSVDRQSVEVKFNFGEREHLSVRVAYKDGQVQATFNTDSTELRTAISHAWNAQNASPEQRSYRLADPVFTGASSHSSSNGNGSNQSNQSRSFAEAPGFNRSSNASDSVQRSAQSTTETVPSRANLRPEVAGRLNAIV